MIFTKKWENSSLFILRQKTKQISYSYTFDVKQAFSGYKDIVFQSRHIGFFQRG